MPYQMVYIPEKTKKKVRKKRKSTQKAISDDSATIKREIADLKQKRERLIAAGKKDLAGKKGLKKFGSKLGYSRQLIVINDAIKQREQYLGRKFGIKAMKQQVEFNQARKQLQAETAIKPISSDDIFGNLI